MSGVGLPAILVSLLVTCPASRTQMASLNEQLGAKRSRPQVGAKNASCVQSGHQLPPTDQPRWKHTLYSSSRPTLLFFPASPPFTKNLSASPAVFMVEVLPPLPGSGLSRFPVSDHEPDIY